jgi:hypothetical protein
MAEPKQSPQQEFVGGLLMMVFGTFFLVLVGVLAGRDAWHAVWLRLAYRPAEAIVADRRLAEQGTRRGHSVYRLEASLTYQADGREYQSWVPWRNDVETSSPVGDAAEALFNRLQPGDRVTCYYSATDPAEVVMDRGNLTALWGALGGMAIPVIVVIAGTTLVATRWRVVWPRGLEAEVRHARQRLPRRFYLLVGVVLVCVVTVIVALLTAGGQGFLLLIPAIIITILCVRGAAGIVRRTVLPSPEKRAATAAAAGESAATDTSSATAVNEFFASLESAPEGRAAIERPAAIAGAPRKASVAWNRADPIRVSQGEYLPVRLKTNALDDNKGKIVGTGYLLLLLVVIVVGSTINAVRGIAAPPAHPNPGGWAALLGMVGAGAVIAIVAGLGWRRFRRMSGVVVEVSAHPFPAGQTEKVVVYHPDAGALDRLRLELRCEEDAYAGTSGKGNRPVTETKVVLRQPIDLDPPMDAVEPRRGRIDVPLAPGSFSVGLHRVRWYLQGRLGFWTLRYPVEVREPLIEADALAPSAGERSSNRINQGAVSLWIDGDTNAVLPGATMTGGFHVRTHPDAVPLNKLELSVLWTAARRLPPVLAGLVPKAARHQPDSPDLGVCHFDEHEASDDDAAELGARHAFRVVLPDGPPSFRGKQFDITWAVRLRATYADGDQSVCDLPFILAGSVTTQSLDSAADE